MRRLTTVIVHEGLLKKLTDFLLKIEVDVTCSISGYWPSENLQSGYEKMVRRIHGIIDTSTIFLENQGTYQSCATFTVQVISGLWRFFLSPAGSTATF